MTHDVLTIVSKLLASQIGRYLVRYKNQVVLDFRRNPRQFVPFSSTALHPLRTQSLAIVNLIPLTVITNKINSKKVNNSNE